MIVVKMDVEAMVLHTGLRLLSRVGQDGRRRVLAYWCARAESLPLTDGNGRVLVEHPVENEPPLLRFAHEHREAEAPQPEA
jgi:hypothetical protein